MNNIDWTRITNNAEIIRLIKEREQIEKQIRAIDDMALVRYEIEALKTYDPDATTYPNCFTEPSPNRLDLP